MARNRRKHTNPLPVGGIARCGAVVFILGLCGLTFVAFKNQAHVNGGTINLLEKELVELRTKNEVVRARISSLSSRSYLQKRLDSGFIAMVPIPNSSIVRFDGSAPDSEVTAIRAVANERAGE